ncbi:MAG: dihydropteroate synthase [Planctomycetaceae bacterium]|nr:dihydropteroate synthase [Planctomycetaceae bacterium]
MSDSNSLLGERILFVTGRLAENSLRETVSALSSRIGFSFQIAVPGVQVAALLHVSLLKNRLKVPADVDRVILPGWVQGDERELTDHFGKPFERGPKDLRDLPEYFGLGRRGPESLDKYSIEIIGEINHATRMPTNDVVSEALRLSQSGADVIDVGCVPGESSGRVRELVSELRQQNLRVSIDSFDRSEVEQAVDAGAELILSCNHSNLEWVIDLGAEVVAIPDTPSDPQSLRRVMAELDRRGVSYRADPIIEPIGMGFTASLQRYVDIRREFPDVPMMMGIGNVTELTEVDSAGVNVLLAAICEELGIQSVLTTQVINWCRSAVAEFDAARRMIHYAVTRGCIPKHLNSSLVMLRDARIKRNSAESLSNLAAQLTDDNFRIFAEESGLHLMNRSGHWVDESPFSLLRRAMGDGVRVDAEHAFYLGYELARAEICRQLGKQYVQDEPLGWGLAGTLPGSASIHHKIGQHHDDSDSASSATSFG